MKKFLFTDGTTGVMEVQGTDELEDLIRQAAHPSRVRIWVYSSNEWISYDAYRKLYPAPLQRSGTTTGAIVSQTLPATSRKKAGGFRKMVYLFGAVAGVLLAVNFTQIKWEKADPVTSTAARPLNMPQMDIDSLIEEVEGARGQSLDRSTRTNLRLRNTWPDRILLQVAAERETNGSSSRFYNVNVSIDNTTGFFIDNAVVRYFVWRNGKIGQTDTLQFQSIRYDKLSKRQAPGRFRGDSISVAFESIRARAFNFCYSASTKNNSGNYNDRWFCRE